MPRPRPLGNVATARPQVGDYQALTPRTPHSRSGRAEEGFTEVELEEIRDADDDYRTYGQQQTEPLLASSASASFPPTGFRARGDNVSRAKNRPRRMFDGLTMEMINQRIPLVIFAMLAGLLLILIVVSYDDPETLQSFFLGEANNVTSQSIVEPSKQEEFDLPTSVAADEASPTSLPSPLQSPPDSTHYISYENYTTFPLLSTEYRHECHVMMGSWMTHSDYWVPPADGKVMDVPHNDIDDSPPLPEGGITKVCSSTITYMLDGNVGLMADLALLAQAAALARERNRTFLINDVYWNRGRWTDHFQDVRSRQPGPEPGCRPPPTEELVACPRLARHWVISSLTAKYHLGHPFANHYEDAYSHGVHRLKPLFDFASTSFIETIRPNAQNAEHIRTARQEFAQQIASVDGPNSRRDNTTAAYVGVHIRRGDRLAVSWAYHSTQVPVPKYSEAVDQTWTRLFPEAQNSSSMVYIASDSPAAQEEFIDLIPNSVVYSLARSENSELQDIASLEPYVQADFNEMAPENRIKFTRGMIVDFAMVSGVWSWEGDIVPRATICTITSSVCRLSVVGLGWERSFGTMAPNGYINEDEKGWVEIDNRDQVEPSWQAFELFF